MWWNGGVMRNVWWNGERVRRWESEWKSGEMEEWVGEEMGETTLYIALKHVERDKVNKKLQKQWLKLKDGFEGLKQEGTW